MRFRFAPPILIPQHRIHANDRRNIVIIDKNMNFKFFHQKTWLFGGMSGVIVCVGLFLFYMFIYFPGIEKFYAADIEKTGYPPAWTTALIFPTGHFLPFLSGFFVPYGFQCEFTEPHCTHWSADYEPGSEPWTLDGQKGYCIQKSMAPSAACADKSEAVGFWFLSAVLVGIYFMVGAIIGGLIQELRKK